MVWLDFAALSSATTSSATVVRETTVIVISSSSQSPRQSDTPVPTLEGTLGLPVGMCTSGRWMICMKYYKLPLHKMDGIIWNSCYNGNVGLSSMM